VNTGTQVTPEAGSLVAPPAAAPFHDAAQLSDAAESTLTRGRLTLEYTGTIAAFVLITAAAYRLHATFSTLSFAYFLIIVLAALRCGIWEATALSVAATGCLDYYFTPPLFSLRVTHGSDWIALLAFEAAGLIVSRLSAQAQHHARVANRERRNIEKLYNLSRQILLLDSHAPAGEQIAEFVRVGIGVESVAVFDFATARVYRAGVPDSQLEKVVRTTWIDAQDRSEPGLHYWSRLLRTGDRSTGAIALQAKTLNPLVVDAVASIAAVALARSRSLEQETRAEAARQSEHLRGAVLDALAHAFKTPLTVIRAVSSGLLEAGSLNAQQAELVSLIDDESAQLNDLATRLLRTARLEGAAIPERHGQCDIVQVTRQVLDAFTKASQGRRISFSSVAASSEVSAGADLVATALSQIVDNAIKYSWPGSEITVGITTGESETVVAFHNLGPVIGPAERERIFERFYRGSGTEYCAPGTGLGLSIAMKVAESHQGRIWVVSGENSGTTFFFALPNPQVNSK
jgi:two-component system sensor histidine kinase KdpD